MLTGFFYIHLDRRRRGTRALEASEGRYRTLVEAMREGLARTDEHGVITYANPCFCEMLGYSLGELVGQPADGFIEERSRQDYLRQIPARKIAALRYSGSWSRKKYEQKKTLLEEFIRNKGLRTRGQDIFARYDPPFQIPFFRRNEVLFEVE